MLVKSLVLSVTKIKLCTRAVDAIKLSNAGRGFGMCNSAHFKPIALSIGNIRPAKVTSKLSTQLSRATACISSFLWRLDNAYLRCSISTMVLIKNKRPSTEFAQWLKFGSALPLSILRISDKATVSNKYTPLLQFIITHLCQCLTQFWRHIGINGIIKTHKRLVS